MGVGAIAPTDRGRGASKVEHTGRRKKRQPYVVHVEGEELKLNLSTGQAYFYLPHGPAGRRKRFYQGPLLVPSTRSPNPATLQRATRWLREYKAAGGLPRSAIGLTMQDLAGRYKAHIIEEHGAESSEAAHTGYALDFLTKLYGTTLFVDFGSLSLIAVRKAMAVSGRWTRGMVNSYLYRMKQAFRWGVTRELVPADKLTALIAVEGERWGRSCAREGKKVAPVADEQIDAVLPLVSRQVRAIIELQRLTGARAGEIVALRPAELDRWGEVWTYRPSQHKGAHRGLAREIFIGSKGRAVLNPFLIRPAEMPCFSPKEAEQERLEARHFARLIPNGYGNRPGTNRRRKPRVTPGDAYTTASYRRAIQRACAEAKVAVWSPHQLRHKAATEVRRKYGLEAAKAMLGHTDVGTTEHYAQMDRELAARIAREVG
jgi:integrase